MTRMMRGNGLRHKGYRGKFQENGRALSKNSNGGGSARKPDDHADLPRAEYRKNSRKRTVPGAGSAFFAACPPERKRAVMTTCSKRPVMGKTKDAVYAPIPEHAAITTNCFRNINACTTIQPRRQRCDDTDQSDQIEHRDKEEERCNEGL